LNWIVGAKVHQESGKAVNGKGKGVPKTLLPFISSFSSAEDITNELRQLIDKPAANEITLKQFFEAYPGAIPTTPWLQNHGVHFDFVFPQYPIGNRFKPDFLYLTKSSLEWWCVLVEIESPHAKLFQDRGKSPKKHSDLTAALDRIADWRSIEDGVKSCVFQVHAGDRAKRRF
jgi:hypothetical protein